MECTECGNEAEYITHSANDDIPMCGECAVQYAREELINDQELNGIPEDEIDEYIMSELINDSEISAGENQ